MPTTERPSGVEQELTQALDELAAALQRAGEATATIRSIVPRLAATGSVLDEIEALVSARRGQLVAVAGPVATPSVAYGRPALVVPGAPSPKPRPAPRREAAQPAAGAVPQPPRAIASERPVLPAALTPPSEMPVPLRAAEPIATAPFPDPADEVGVTCFRLEFESKPGPLDLRKVDDAVGEHPAVRDVALLDYDGRRATLKVWIAATSTPAEVQDALKQRTAELFAPGHDITIVALEDVA